MAERVKAAARPQREPAAAWRVIDGEAVMVLPSSGRVHTLNGVGTRFWELVDGTRTLGDIAGQLAEEFDAPAARIETDCHEFARELRERGLLSVGL